MKLNRKLLAALLCVCMVMALVVPAAAAEMQASYSEAKYYDIAITTYSRSLMLLQGGVAPAADQSGKYGLVDPSGKIVLPFQYTGIWPMGGGLFRVEAESDSICLGIVNAQGKILVAPSTNIVHVEFQNGTLLIEDKTTGAKYYTPSMAPSTEEAFYGTGSDPLDQYDSGWAVSGGYYKIYSSGKCGLLGSDYKEVIPAGTYSDIVVVSHNGQSVFIVTKDGKLGVLDSKLKTVVPFGTYDRIYAHERGGAALDVYKDSQRGAVGFDGKVLVPLGSYSEIGGLNDNGYITAINSDRSASTLYRNGSAVNTFSGKWVSSEVYYRDLAFTTTEGERNGIMDANGKVIIPENYDYIESGVNDDLLTYTKQENSWRYLYGLYTIDGKQIFTDTYSEISYLGDGKYKLNNGTYYGVSKVTGSSATSVIPMKYQDLRIYSGQLVELYDGAKYSIVDLSNKEIVPESTESIDIFGYDSLYSGIYALQEALSTEYDSYTKSLQPLLPLTYKTGSGYATVYYNLETSKVEGQIPYFASFINEDGWFVYQGANGRYGFARIGNDVQNEPQNESQNKFLDVPADTWYTDAVNWAAEKGYIKGTSKNYFSPNEYCSQQDILLMIWRSKDKPAASVTAPVTASDYAKEAVNWAYEQGMIDDTFVGTKNCTRAQAVEFLWKMVGSPSAPASSFPDVPDDASYAMAVNWAVEKNITKGAGGGRFDPNGSCERCMIATFLYRAYNN